MRIRFLEVAQIELDDAVDYYNKEVPELGGDFLNELLRTLDQIMRFPEAWPSCSKRARKCFVRRFPYNIIYQERSNEILVIAIACFHRKPDYWKDRL